MSIMGKFDLKSYGTRKSLGTHGPYVLRKRKQSQQLDSLLNSELRFENQAAKFGVVDFPCILIPAMLLNFAKPWRSRKKFHHQTVCETDWDGGRDSLFSRRS